MHPFGITVRQELNLLFFFILFANQKNSFSRKGFLDKELADGDVFKKRHELTKHSAALQHSQRLEDFPCFFTETR